MTTTQNLSEKSGPELVSIYNDIASKVGEKPVKKFASRAAGAKRILGLLAKNPEVAPASPEPVAKPATTAKVKKAEGETKSSRPFDLPANPVKRPYRENSGRGKLISALREGRTFDQLRKEFPQWNEGQLTKTIRMLSWWLGYQVKEDGLGGKITLHD